MVDLAHRERARVHQRDLRRGAAQRHDERAPVGRQLERVRLRPDHGLAAGEHRATPAQVELLDLVLAPDRHVADPAAAAR
jgi:hypothetical protein